MNSSLVVVQTAKWPRRPLWSWHRANPPNRRGTDPYARWCGIVLPISFWASSRPRGAKPPNRILWKVPLLLGVTS